MFLLLTGAAQISGTPKISFTAVGSGGLHIDGDESALRVEDALDLWRFRVPLASLATGIALRDRHMREHYLQVQKYPEAQLEIPKPGLKLPADRATLEADALGTLTLHGVSKSVAVHYRVTRHGEQQIVEASFAIDLRDYAIEVPTYLGVTVKPAITVRVDCTLAGT